jgi:hypothetical protein
MLSKKINIKRTNFSILFGQNGWIINPINKNYMHLVVTSDGVYMDGKSIAKGKLKLV